MRELERQEEDSDDDGKRERKQPRRYDDEVDPCHKTTSVTVLFSCLIVFIIAVAILTHWILIIRFHITLITSLSLTLILVTDMNCCRKPVFLPVFLTWNKVAHNHLTECFVWFFKCLVFHCLTIWSTFVQRFRITNTDVNCIRQTLLLSSKMFTVECNILMCARLHRRVLHMGRLQRSALRSSWRSWNINIPHWKRTACRRRSLSLRTKIVNWNQMWLTVCPLTCFTNRQYSAAFTAQQNLRYLWFNKFQLNNSLKKNSDENGSSHFMNSVAGLLVVSTFTIVKHR